MLEEEEEEKHEENSPTAKLSPSSHGHFRWPPRNASLLHPRRQPNLALQLPRNRRLPPHSHSLNHLSPSSHFSSFTKT